MRAGRLRLLILSLSLPLAACSSPDETNPPPPPPSPHAPQELAPLAKAPLGTDTTIEAVHAVVKDPPLTPNPEVPADLEALLADGFGDTKGGPGAALVPQTLDDAAPPAPGSKAKMLTRFVHLADTQLADDESPIRLANFDSPGATGAAFRPQEGYECRVLNAAVRTIHAVHGATPLDFVLVGGDNADNAQANELDWFQEVMDGAPRVECDSGKDDDPAAGGSNDPKDPFVAVGLPVPWKWVTGNHDVLVQGNFPASGYVADAVGGYSANGARDWSQSGGPVVTGDIPADPKRAVMDRKTMVEKVAEAGDGHGIDAAAKASGKAQYTFDVEGTPLRFIVLDTAAETGGAQGILRKGDLDGFIKPAMDAAKKDGKWVILTSHHAPFTLGDGSAFGGEKQPDALTVDAWITFVGGYDNVLMYLAGHTHVHRVTKLEPAGGHPFWVLETSALADYPHQMRVIEIWDQDDGFVSIRAVPLDYSVEGDDIAAEGRRRGVTDYTSGWTKDGRGDPNHRAVELWFPKPF